MVWGFPQRQKGKHNRKDTLVDYTKALGKFWPQVAKEVKEGLHSELDQNIIGLC